MLTGKRDVNRRDAEGGRLSTLWRPTERFSMKLSALSQDSDRRGSADVNRTLLLASGEPQQSAPLGTGVYDRHSAVVRGGALFGANPPLVPTINKEDDSFTYLLTPRWKISSDLMLYARLASGYRPGGANNCSIPVPCTYEPDTLRNYEVGFKGSVLDRALSFDLSLYHIDWQDIQVQLAFGGNGALPFQANAGRAESEGVELSVESRPLTGLTLSAWVALGTAELTEDLPLTVGSGRGKQP